MSGHRDEYLQVLYDLEAGPGTAFCQCRKPALWGCLECVGYTPLCTDCLQHSHALLPFHHVEFWSQSCWKAAWLRTVGIQIHLGHRGLPCTCLMAHEISPDSHHGATPSEAEAKLNKASSAVIEERNILPLPRHHAHAQLDASPADALTCQVRSVSPPHPLEQGRGIVSFETVNRVSNIIYRAARV